MLQLCYKTSFPKNPNQNRQLTVLTMPDSAFVFVLQDYTTFMTSQNLDYKMFTRKWRWPVCLSDIPYL